MVRQPVDPFIKHLLHAVGFPGESNGPGWTEDLLSLYGILAIASTAMFTESMIWGKPYMKKPAMTRNKAR
jgi:hypothetical protein